jgi:hypothetical protein
MLSETMAKVMYQEIVPSTNHTACMPLDELAQRNGHFLLDGDRGVHMARDAKELGALVALATKSAREAN